MVFFKARCVLLNWNPIKAENQFGSSLRAVRYEDHTHEYE